MTSPNYFLANIRGAGKRMLKRPIRYAPEPEPILVLETPPTSPERERPKLMRTQAMVIPEDISDAVLFTKIEAAMDRVRALEAELATVKAREKSAQESRERIYKTLINHSLHLDSLELRLVALERPRPPPLPFFLPIPGNLSIPTVPQTPAGSPVVNSNQP